MEQWKEIPRFSRYMVSNLGNLKSKNYKRTGREQLLKPCDTGGYLQTMILNDFNKYETRKIHYLVALAFLGYRKDGLVVNHKDGNKHNNNIENLEYCTQSYNSKHSFDTGLQLPKKGELNGMSKLTQEKVNEIRYIAKNNGRYWGRNRIAKELGVSPKHLQSIVNDKNTSWR